jgi:putative transposase
LKRSYDPPEDVHRIKSSRPIGCFPHAIGGETARRRQGEMAKLIDRRDQTDRDRWARLRFAIIGPLLAAPPRRGELQNVLRELSSRTWQHPVTGLPVRFGKSTLERWFLAARRAKQDPVAALKRRVRADAGRYRALSPRLIEALHAQYRSHPTWAIKLHYDNLRALLEDEEQFASYTTIRSYFRSKGLRKIPRRSHRVAVAKQFASRESRSFEVEHVNGCWHLDFHECSRHVLTAQGEWAKPVALCIIDDHSRLICHIQWGLSETAKTLVHGFSQALMRRGLPRSLLTDNGAAMMAEEFKNGLHTLGILHQTTLPLSPWQNGKQEAIWGNLEGRLIAMLEGVRDLTLELLNRATHAWVEHEYHQTRHAELGCTPLEAYRAGPDVGRECPSADSLRRAFRMEVARTQRLSDGTFSLEGHRFEVPSQFGHLERLRLRYARWDFSFVDLVDERSGIILCPLYPLDKTANASGERQVRAPPVSIATDTGSTRVEMAPLLKKLLAEFAATGLPPPYLPEEDGS